MRLRPAHLHLREGDSAIVPLPALDLPRELELDGESWLRKAEFHLTAAHGPHLAGLLAASGIAEQEAADRVEAAMRRVTWDFEIGEIELLGELRDVRDDGERTIVAMARMPDLDRLHERLGAEAGFEPAPPPAHVTIYTGPEERGGIGLHSAEEVERLSTPLGGPAADRLRAALAASFPG